MILGDNSVRVIRTDNNKCVVSHSNASFRTNSQRCNDLGSSSNLLVVPNGDRLQFVDFSEEYLVTHSLSLRPRNTVSTAEGGIPRTMAQVTAFAVSPDQSTLCTLDELFDSKTQIRSVTLRFWSRVSADFSEFSLEQVTHIGTKTGTQGLPMSIVSISNKSFAVSLGNEDVRIWSQMRQDGKEARLVWQVVSALRLRDLKVKQLVPNIRLKLDNVSP